MGDHPVFRYPVFRERCTVGAREGVRRWGWVCSQPRGEGQAESDSAFEGFRTGTWLGRRRLPRPRGLRPFSRRPRWPLVPTFRFPSTFAPSPAVPVGGKRTLRIRDADARGFCSLFQLSRTRSNSGTYGGSEVRTGNGAENARGAPGDCRRHEGPCGTLIARIQQEICLCVPRSAGGIARLAGRAHDLRARRDTTFGHARAFGATRPSGPLLLYAGSVRRHTARASRISARLPAMASRSPSRRAASGSTGISRSSRPHSST